MSLLTINRYLIKTGEIVCESIADDLEGNEEIKGRYLGMSGKVTHYAEQQINNKEERSCTH